MSMLPIDRATASSIGVVNSGSGTVNVGGSVTGTLVTGGPSHLVQASAPEVPDDAASRQGQRDVSADIAILTVLRVEMQAVIAMLARNGSQVDDLLLPNKQPVKTTLLDDGRGGTFRAVAGRTLDPGPTAALAAHTGLRVHVAPTVEMLVGIAGGVSASVAIGDVVIADQTILYEARKETAGATTHRGMALPISPRIKHAVNAFIDDHDAFADPSTGDPFQVHVGPIGSGGAVIADAGSEIRVFLAQFNDKVLAVETEAAGLAYGVHAESSSDSARTDWVTVRGISDAADAHKGDDAQATASRRAAHVTRMLMPYLVRR